MPRPRHQLDLLWLPRDPDRPAPASRDALHRTLTDHGWRAAQGPSGAPGPRVEELVAGGCAAMRVEVLPKVALWANQQGGYRVRCRGSGELVSGAFMEAVSTWRAGGVRALACPACGETHAFEQLGFEPPAALACWALVLRDVQTASPAEGGQARLEALWGPLRWLVRRAW